MKRPFQRRRSVRSSDPFEDLNTEQLSYIGAIALMYNDVEAFVDGLCATALHAQIKSEELTSRINGVDGKLALIKLGARNWGFEEVEMKHLEDVLGDSGFKLLKKWRDAVIHAQVLDAKSAVGKVTERQGKVSEVLLSLDALAGLFHRLDIMRIELKALKGVMGRKQTFVLHALRDFEFDLNDQDREQLEQGIRDEWALAQEHRNLRLSLPQIPEFPEDTPALELFLGTPESLAEILQGRGGLFGI